MHCVVIGDGALECSAKKAIRRHWIPLETGVVCDHEVPNDGASMEARPFTRAVVLVAAKPSLWTPGVNFKAS